MYVVYESPLQMCVDYPSAYRNQPGIEFLRHVPASWHKTKTLNGEIGKYITMVRRSGDEWYLGSITNWEEREIEITLDFLKEKDYQAHIFQDNISEPFSKTEPVIFEIIQVTNGDKMQLKLASGGGCAVRFVPINQQ